MFKFGSKNDISIENKCTVRLLDDNEILQCDFQRDQKGQYLIDYVCSQLNLLEKDYFGLRYVDQNKQRHWLDPTRSVLKQLKGMTPIIFCFRVKFYPPDPYRLKEEITRYQIFLQLRRDLLHGRLYCNQNDSALLAAYIIQSELGDYDPDEHVGNYVSEFKLLLKQTPRIEEKIAEIHQTQLRGQVPSVAEMNFLRKACLLDTYGVDPHPVKDHRGTQLYLGVNHAGILTFQGSKKTHHFKWQDVQKLNYEGKMFIVHLIFNEKKHTVGFKCPTGSACRHLWRCAVEQRLFYTLPSSSEAPSVVTGGSFFSRGSRFRYSGRVEKEILEDATMIKREPPHFVRNSMRSLSLRQKSSTFSNSSQTSQDLDDGDGYPIMTRPTHSTSLSESHLSREDDASLRDYHHEESYPLSLSSFSHDDGLEPVDEDQEIGSYSPTGTIDDSLPEYYGLDYRNHLDANHIHDKCELSPSELDKEAKYAPLAQSENFEIQSSWKRRYLKLLISSLLFVVFLLTGFMLFLLESNSEFLSDIRKLPELVILRREYYEPAKEYIAKKISSMFQATS